MRVVEKDVVLIGQLEHLGEGYVRAMLADGGFPRSQKAQVEAWLYEKEAVRRDFRDKQAALSVESLQSAANACATSAEASWRAVEGVRQAVDATSDGVAAAERAARWAMWAAFIALLTVVVPIMADHISSLLPIIEERLR